MKLQTFDADDYKKAAEEFAGRHGLPEEFIAFACDMNLPRSQERTIEDFLEQVLRAYRAA